MSNQNQNILSYLTNAKQPWKAHYISIWSFSFSSTQLFTSSVQHPPIINLLFPLLLFPIIHHREYYNDHGFARDDRDKKWSIWLTVLSQGRYHVISVKLPFEKSHEGQGSTASLHTMYVGNSLRSARPNQARVPKRWMFKITNIFCELYSKTALWLP